MVRSKELTLDILDEAIKAVGDVRHKNIVQIYLNPDDWQAASQNMEVFTGVASDSAFGIPVTTDPALKHGTFILEYSVLGTPQLVGWEVKGG